MTHLPSRLESLRRRAAGLSGIGLAGMLTAMLLLMMLLMLMLPSPWAPVPAALAAPPTSQLTGVEQARGLATGLGPPARSADSLQIPAPGLSSLLSGPVDPTTYVMGPGDVLILEKASPAGTAQVVTVDAEGAVYIPDLGRREVAGRTLAAARRSVLADLHHYFPHTQIELRLVQPRTFKVFLLGETDNPGTVAASATNRAVEALTQRGALLKTSSLRNISLHRVSGEVQRVDVQAFLQLGDVTHNPWLADGDRMVIPPLRTQVYVSGAVQRPGFYELAPDDSLSTILRLAGGLTEDARPDSVLVTRFRSATETDSGWVSLARGAARPLSADDRIFVRRQFPWHPLALVMVEGEVRRPGEYPIREGSDRISDLLPLTGGFTPEASLGNAVLVRETEPTLMNGPDLNRLERLGRADMTPTEYQDIKMRTEGRNTSFALDLSRPPAPGSQDDLLLRAGDRLVVGSAYRQVRVGGAVHQPGLFGYRPDLVPDDYVRLAGGFGARASRGQIRVIRSADGQSLAAREVMHMSPGDYVWVPEKQPGMPAWSLFKDIVAVGAQLATLYLVIKK